MPRDISQSTDSLWNMGWLELSLKIGGLPERLGCFSMREMGRSLCHSKQRKRHLTNHEGRVIYLGLWSKGGMVCCDVEGYGS